MKKIICLLLATMLCLCGCASEEEEEVLTVGIFSFALAQEYFQNQEEGVMHSGFRNTSESPITDGASAVKRAKNECVVSYDSVVVSYDETADMYCVCFYTKNVEGGDQLVYMGSNGITKLVVFG